MPDSHRVFDGYRDNDDYIRTTNCKPPSVRVMILYVIYTLILAYVTLIVVLEFLSEKRWKTQIAMIMVLLIFTLRLMQIK